MPATESQEPVYVCTTTPEDAPRRKVQIEDLAAGLISRRRDGQEVRLRFDPALAEQVHAFVRDESECCEFYEFEVSETPDAVQLRVSAPGEAEPLLESLFEVFGSADVTGHAR